MNDENDNDFDFDSGVADIADSLGLDSGDSRDEEGKQGPGDDAGQAADIENKGDETVTDGVQNADVQETVEAKAPPASWAKDTHEIWSKLPPEAQAQIELREKQMLDGIEQYKGGYQYAQAVSQAIEPFRQEIAAAGVDEVSAIVGLMNHHRALTTGTIEQRQQALLQIGIASGIIPKEGQTAQDLERQAYEQQIRQYQIQEQQRQKQYIDQQAQQISQSVEAFAKDKEYFDEVVDDMLPYLKAGHDLQTAYDKALYANPVTRAKEIAKEQQKTAAERAEQQRKEAEAARKAASVNMRSAQRKGSSSEPMGSWDDTLAETLNNIKNR